MRVVVVGAGYAGTIAATTVVRRARDVEVVVVNPRATFVERVRLHEHLAGSGSASQDLATMLDPRIELVLGTAERIGDGQVELTDGSRQPFDALVLAVGSGARPLDGTVELTTWEGAEVARTRLAELGHGAVVTVVGAGLTGIETAAELAESRPDLSVRLIGPVLGPSLSDGGRARVRRHLDRAGVEVVLDAVTAVEPDGGSDKLVLRESGVVMSDLTLWAITRTTSDLASRSGLSVDADGRAVVDEHLRSIDDERVFVVGDCAAVPGARLACATAMPQGSHVGRTIARMTRARRPRRFSMGYVGQAVSLGRRDAVIQVVRRDDSPRRAYLAGRVAVWVKEAICRSVVVGARTGVYAWARGPR